MVAPVELATAFEQRFTSIAAEVRPADPDAPDAGTVVAVLVDQAERFNELADWTRQSVAALTARENMFPGESRHGLERIVELFRDWAPRFAGLHLPEAHPIALPIPHLVRPFNDAVRAITRALIDGAHDVNACRLLADTRFTEKVAAAGDEIIAEHADILADLAK